MSHYAQIKTGLVEQVIVAEQDFINTLPDATDWIQTSYNTRANQHLLGGTPLRGNYAGVGYIYDAVHDVFYAPQPFPSWSLDSATWTWQPPVAEPQDGKLYNWNESTGDWDEA
jgi:hypothetical protein